MKHEPVVIREDDLEWEIWRDREGAQRNLVYYKTLVSAGITRSEALTAGMLKIPPGEALNTHHHEQVEFYLILEGSGMVEISSRERPVEPGSAVFIPRNAPHCIENTGACDLIFVYVFPVNSFGEIEYSFGSPAP